MKELYIFDFDGTLADTLPLAFMCFRETFLKYNGELLTNEQIVATFGASEQVILKRHLRDEQTQNEAIHFFYQLYQANHNLYADCPTKIRQMLQQLKQNGKKIAVFTGKARKSLDYSLAELGLADLFDFTVCDDDVFPHSKPAPHGLLKIQQHFNLPASAIVYYGDSEADVISGQQAGIETHKIDWISNPTSSVEVAR